MVFSSPIFLFLFLPLVLTIYPILPGLRVKNLWLLLVSIVFYAWGETLFVFLMIASGLMNCALGLWVEKKSGAARAQWAVGAAVALNIGLLAFFKYANFIVDNINWLLALLRLGLIHLPPVRLPIGISFFTFHSLSYVIDIYRRKARAARSPADVALYIFFFPQLIAGPILRWSAMAPQFARRIVTGSGFVEGIRRFVGGLAKKTLIANAVALPADQIFALPFQQRSPAVAWFGALCYTLQIYFDFSGYSDMAVGLGKMFGFEFIENFNYPYISQSVREFWRRWHISLSTWFRDYVYLPLGGNRGSAGRTYFNLIVVFLLCGLWHGASWTFVVWGLYHGLFLALERTRFGSFVACLPQTLRHAYALFLIVIGWVLFRAENFPRALQFLGSMFDLHQTAGRYFPLAGYFGHQVAWSVLAGLVFSLPLWPWLVKIGSGHLEKLPRFLQLPAHLVALVLEPLLLTVLLLMSAAWLAGGTYNPFIYFRF